MEKVTKEGTVEEATFFLGACIHKEKTNCIFWRVQSTAATRWSSCPGWLSWKLHLSVTSVTETTISSSNSSVDEESSDDTCSIYDTDFVNDDGDDTILCIHAPSPAETTTTNEEESNIQIQLGLPHNIRALVNNQYTEFQVPPYSSLLTELVFKNLDSDSPLAWNCPITSTRSKCLWTRSLFLLKERKGTNLSLHKM